MRCSCCRCSEMRRYIPPAAIIAALYILNRLCFIPATTGPLHRLLAWHGADFLAGALMLCVVNGLLALTGRPPLRRFAAVALFLLGCGLFWEMVTPLYLPRSVGDPWDVLACWLGGVALWLWDQYGKPPSA